MPSGLRRKSTCLLFGLSGLVLGIAGAEATFGRLRTDASSALLFSVELRDEAGALLASPMLVGEDGQVLGYYVPEVGTEHPDVEASAIAEANHRLRIELISNTDARRKRLIGIVDITVESDRTVAGDPNYALRQVGETTVALAVDVFGIVDLPTQTIVESQLCADAPRVLTVEEPALLPLCG